MAHLKAMASKRGISATKILVGISAKGRYTLLR
jgi:hypothetical protein